MPTSIMQRAHKKLTGGPGGPAGPDGPTGPVFPSGPCGEKVYFLSISWL